MFWILVMAAIWAVVGLAFVVAFSVLGLRFDVRARAWLPEGRALQHLAPGSRWARFSRRKEAAPVENPPSG